MESAMNQDNPLVEFHVGSQVDNAEGTMAHDVEHHVSEENKVMESSDGCTGTDDKMGCSTETDPKLNVGEGTSIQEPYVGMEFESEEAARLFYNAYAMQVGFGSRVSRNRRSRKDGETIARNFVCCKEGFRLRRHGDNGGRARRNRANTREGCMAMISIKKTNLGKWAVSKFVKEHNHPLLSPSEVRSLRSHRNVSDSSKKSDAEPHVDDDLEMIEHFEGAENLEPFEGMELESEEAARIFYSAYARRTGFRSRISKNRRSRKNGEIIARTFVCYKEGYRLNRHDSKKDRIYRPRAITREGCEAMIMVKKTSSAKWVIAKFVKEHSHPLLDPSNMRGLRSHNVSGSSKKPTEGATRRKDASDVMSGVVAKDGESDNAGSTEPVRSNHIEALRKRKRFPDKDPQDVIDYLERMQSENPAFFYAAKIDVDETLHCIFWVDARSRMAYNYFGDVVHFDTNYKTDQYEVPFAPFTGVNHHQQSTLFGCALLFDEAESTFVWLFNSWLEAMSGRHPVTIITDQDEVIGEAIAQVFPKTHHCFCKWDILYKAPKQLANVERSHPTFRGEFQKCVNLTETVHEFESCWKSLIDKFGLKKNQWLRSLYSARQKWAPVYLQNTFIAQISATQQSESTNSYFDGYVFSNTSMQDFVMQYERALASRYEMELEEDIRTTHTKPSLKTTLPIEKQAANTYTRTVFLKFQEEVFESLGYVANKVKEEEAVSTYEVTTFEEHERARTVMFNASERRASCSCLMFEFSGVLCRHALIVFTLSNFMTLPSYYILERWTRNAKSVVGLDKRGVAMQANCRKSPTLRHSFLCKQAIRCAEVGATSVQDYDVAMRALREAWEKIVASKNKGVGVGQLDTQVSGSLQGPSSNAHIEMHNITNRMTLGNLQQPKKRGRPRKSTSKPDAEKAIKNIKKCAICKEHGHDDSNCPRLRPIGGSFGTGGGMILMDTGPSELHGHGGLGGEQLGFSEGILGLSLGDRFDSHVTSGIPNFGPNNFFQISLANSRLFNVNEEFSLTGARPSGP
ncbi:protein FAR1-RELATED SEQUENCE 5 isoform X2 [Cinnamomum micranthum f. kanehirae]|uniref:Protein FAR1-RELATED SEQUENCE 5 isoform X2 n=1 Tax=Cinnamomum micranthum f. kanehirae TaxID=337451 RepID=A0A443NTN7_9MAGN|nr:protein FAR1-RELATED SEQUENCE 5 isoform X2 [Cinnamomum micranthum f. kanehirae]